MAGSDTSEDSMDSLENQKVPKIPSFIISEPSENLPSITRGIGRKTSQETEVSPKSESSENQQTQEEFFLRRNSDKSSCYSDDSLSNDSLSIGNQSPSSSSNTQSSHGRPLDNAYEKMQITQELANAGTEKFQLFQNLNLNNSLSDQQQISNNGFFYIKPSPDPTNNSGNAHQQQEDLLALAHNNSSSGSFEVELSEVCSKLRATDILEMLRRTINDQVPPKLCVVKSESENLTQKLSLEYEGGIHIELRIVDKQKDSKGLKMRRISGDHLVYSQLCQQLISCMTVS